MRRNGKYDRQQRRLEAEARQTERDTRGDIGQIQELDSRLGGEVGAVKERARLYRRILSGRAA